MKLTVFNGSPRKGANNTEILLKRFLEGYMETTENEYEIYKINSMESCAEAVEIFKKSECILIAFPLYVYSMPTGVKDFIELLEPLCKKCTDKKIGFLVQYGFPEAAHARPLENYLEKLAGMLRCTYMGTIIKGGCDGLIRNAGLSNKKILKGIYNIGKRFGESGGFDAELLKAYAKPERLSKIAQKAMKYIFKIINKYYWGVELKKNGALDKSFDAPYAK